MHFCAEYFFKVKVPPPPSLDELLQFYEQNWLAQGYESADEETKYKAYGREILTKFWSTHSADFHMPLAVERMFYIDIEGVKLRGFIDRVDKLDSGGLSIVDYKTNQELFAADYLEHDLQLTLYQLAAEQIWRLPVERLTLYHLRSNTPCSCPPRQEAQLEQARQLVLEVAANIASERFPATENNFCPCDFPEHCPYYRHQYLKTAAEPARQGVLPGIAAADAVEHYASLQKQIKELKIQLDETKQQIIEFCQNEGLNRVYGSEHDITCYIAERTGFNEDEVRELLEPLGLWQRVLSLDQTQMKQLLTDAGIAADIRNRLKAMERVIATFPQLRVKRHAGEEE